MARFKNEDTGVVFSVADAKVRRYGTGFERLDAGADEGYSGLKVDELKSEIARRNDGRDEDSLLSDEGKKADLIAVLEADDAE